MLPVIQSDVDPTWEDRVHKKEGRTQRVERSFWICFAACALMVLIGFCIVSAGADDGAVREYARPLCNSVLAGLSTGLGGLVVLLMGIPSNEVMAGVLGLAAGVMLTVSVFDMWLPAVRQHGIMTPSIGFAIGWVVFVVLDYCIPESLASGEMDADGGDEEAKGPEGSNQAWRLAILMAITLTIHNVPEGIAVVVSSIESWRGGTIMTLAISLHNIPEGLVIATPCYASTGSKRAAILLSLASGLSEPAGAFIAVLLLRPYMTRWLTAHVLACVSGIMVAVSIKEILPQASHYKRPMHLWMGALAGGGVMAMSLALLPE